MGKPDASEAEINKALEMAYLKEFVDEQENGLDTDIGERGSLLSGGQRQRLAIARAFVKNAPIVILDEATSALDNKSEAVVQKAIDNLMQDIRFEDVCFAYNPETPVLKHINLRVKAGTTTAIVGNSGGGKSTVVSLLPRFYDVCSGHIEIDGKDIRDFTLESLRNNIAVVFKNQFLFSGTIRDNILWG